MTTKAHMRGLLETIIALRENPQTDFQAIRDWEGEVRALLKGKPPRPKRGTFSPKGRTTNIIVCRHTVTLQDRIALASAVEPKYRRVLGNDNGVSYATRDGVRLFIEAAVHKALANIRGETVAEEVSIPQSTDSE